MNASQLGYLALVAEITLGTVFLVSSLSKVRHPAAFIHQVGNYGIFSGRPAALFGAALIPAELFVGLSLLSGVLVAAAIPLALALLASFVVAVSVNLRRGPRAMACGCFGYPAEVISGRTLGRLCLLMALAVLTWAAFPMAEQTMSTLTAFEYVRVFAIAFISAIVLLAIGDWMLKLPELGVLTRNVSVVGDKQG